MKKGYRKAELKVSKIKKLIYSLTKIESYNPKYREEKIQLIEKLAKLIQ